MNLQKVVLRDQKNTLRFLFQFQKMKTIVHPQQQQHPTSYKSHYHSSTIVQNNTVKNDENASLSNNNDNNSDEISTQTTTTSSSSSTSNSVDNDTTITKESASSKLKSMLFKDDVDGDNTAGDGVFSKLDEVSADDAVSSGAAKRDEASARASRQLARDNESDGGDRSVEEAESGGDGGVTATTRGGDSVGLQKTHGFGSDTPLKGRSDGDSALTDAPHLFDTDPLTSRVVDSATSVPGSLGAHKVVLEDLPQTATDEQVIAAMTMDFSCNRVVLFCIYIFGFPIAFVFFFFSNFEKIGRVFIFFFFFGLFVLRVLFLFFAFSSVFRVLNTHTICVYHQTKQCRSIRRARLKRPAKRQRQRVATTCVRRLWRPCDQWRWSGSATWCEDARGVTTTCTLPTPSSCAWCCNAPPSLACTWAGSAAVFIRAVSSARSSSVSCPTPFATTPTFARCLPHSAIRSPSVPSNWPWTRTRVTPKVRHSTHTYTHPLSLLSFSLVLCVGFAFVRFETHDEALQGYQMIVNHGRDLGWVVRWAGASGKRQASMRQLMTQLARLQEENSRLRLDVAELRLRLEQAEQRTASPLAATPEPG